MRFCFLFQSNMRNCFWLHMWHYSTVTFNGEIFIFLWLIFSFCRSWEKFQPRPHSISLRQEKASAVPHTQREPRPEHWGGHLVAPREPGVRIDDFNENQNLFLVSIFRWYHGVISRAEAEQVLKSHSEGSYLLRASLETVRTASEAGLNRTEYSLAIKWAPDNFIFWILCPTYRLSLNSSKFYDIIDIFRSSRGFMHLRISRVDDGENTSFKLGDFDKKFSSIVGMVHHYTINR